jgi:PAT family beta-lactamase induction signal transducer AmpG
MASQAPERTTSPVWFGILAIAGGVYFAIPGNVLAFLLSNQGLSPDRIQRVVAAALLPTTWGFALAPVVDLGRKRRDWIIGSAIVAALCLWPAVAWSSASLTLRTMWLVSGGAAASIGGAAFGALMTEFPAHVRGRLGGWYQAGNVGGPALICAMLQWLVPRLSATSMAMALCAAFLLPVLAIFAVPEPPRARLGAGFRSSTSGMWEESREFIKFRRTWAGLLFLLSPAGNSGTVFPGLNKDFHVSANEVSLVTGVTAGIFVGGSLIGGWVADRMGRPRAYILCGLLMAVCGGLVAEGRLSPIRFAVGASAYALVTGFSYAVSTAMVLEVVGGRQRLAATGYSVLYSVSSLPVVYMTYLCGFAYQRQGPRGPMAFDALANAAAAVLLGLFLIWSTRRENGWDLTRTPQAFGGTEISRRHSPSDPALHSEP